MFLKHSKSWKNGKIFNNENLLVKDKIVYAPIYYGDVLREEK